MLTMVTGPVKSGTHAAQKACELLGVPARLMHQPAELGWPGVDGQPADRHVFVARDPRDCAGSWVRFHGKPLTPGTYIAALREYGDGLSIVEDFARYLPWLTDQRTHVLRFETLIASDGPMRGLATYLGVPYLEGAWEELPGLTITWHPSHFDHRTIWTPEVEAVWVSLGGPACLRAWGY